MKKILITGGSDGIGLAIARLLADRGNRITIVARNGQKLKNAVRSLTGEGHRIIALDLSVEEEINLLKPIIQTERYGLLINCAGMGKYGRFTELPLSEQLKMMDLNMKALTILSYCYLKHAAPDDALINIASVLGTTSYPGAAVYAATKAFVTSLSESLWWEYKDRGIYVVGACPGGTYTNFHELSGGSKDSFPKSVMQTPDEVAKEIVRALDKRRKPKIVSGSINKIMLFSQKFLSRRTAVSMMADFGPLKSK